MSDLAEADAVIFCGIDQGLELDSVEGVARTAVNRPYRDDGHLGRVPACTTTEHPATKGTS